MVNNHGMLASVIDKQNRNIYIRMISVYLQYFPSIRPLFAVPRTTEKYFDTRKQLILSFSVLFLYCHNTWHCYLYFAETVVATLFQQFSLFLKELTSSAIQTIYLYIFPIPWHHFYIKMYNKLQSSCIKRIHLQKKYWNSWQNGNSFMFLA